MHILGACHRTNLIAQSSIQSRSPFVACELDAKYPIFHRQNTTFRQSVKNVYNEILSFLPVCTMAVDPPKGLTLTHTPPPAVYSQP